MTPEQHKRQAELEAKRKAHEASSSEPALTAAESKELDELNAE